MYVNGEDWAILLEGSKVVPEGSENYEQKCRRG